MQVGGDATVFAPNYGSPFAHDLDSGRRYATIADFENFVKLAYLHPHLHHSGGTVCEPVDIPVSKRHLAMVYAHLRYSDKAFMGSVTAGERAADSVELARIGFGGDLADRTVMTSLINATSPLVWDATMLAAAEVYAAANQATIITPFILAGAMAPATSAGVAAQTLAEALAGMAFIQLVRPGAPVVFGSFASSMSMQTGAPTFGTPEPALVLYTVAALARRLGVPFRSGGSLTASKLPDAQAAYESAATLIPTLMAGTNFVLHAAGWLEGGLAIGYEKFVLDADQLGMMATFAKGLDLSENGQALDAIRANPPGQHFLGSAHTLANFETAFYRSETADNSSFEQWSEEGGRDAAQRANRLWKERLAAYEPPPIDDAVDEELRDLRRPPQRRAAGRVRMSQESALRELVAGMCFELVPMKSVEAAIAELAPGSTVSVTCSPAKGLDATQELVGRLLDLGHDAVPHLAARQVEDREHVTRLAGWIRRCGLREVFVIAGDAPKAAGPYADSLSFLRDLLEHDTGLERVGVAAYPDGHPFIDRAAPARRAPRQAGAVRRRRCPRLGDDADVLRRRPHPHVALRGTVRRAHHAGGRRDPRSRRPGPAAEHGCAHRGRCVVALPAQEPRRDGRAARARRLRPDRARPGRGVGRRPASASPHSTRTRSTPSPRRGRGSRLCWRRTWRVACRGTPLAPWGSRLYRGNSLPTATPRPPRTPRSDRRAATPQS